MALELGLEEQIHFGLSNGEEGTTLAKIGTRGFRLIVRGEGRCGRGRVWNVVRKWGPLCPEPP